MSAFEIGKRLVAFCKEGKTLESIDALYAQNIESIEPVDPPEGARVVQGIDAVRSKNRARTESVELHSATIEGPWPHGDEKFAVRFTYDVTHKLSGQRIHLDEIGVFTVADGKVIREEFFYGME